MLKYKNTPKTEEVRQARERERNALNTRTHQFIIIRVQPLKK